MTYDGVSNVSAYRVFGSLQENILSVSGRQTYYNMFDFIFKMNKKRGYEGI